MVLISYGERRLTFGVLMIYAHGPYTRFSDFFVTKRILSPFLSVSMVKSATGR